MTLPMTELTKRWSNRAPRYRFSRANTRLRPDQVMATCVSLLRPTDPDKLWMVPPRQYVWFQRLIVGAMTHVAGRSVAEQSQELGLTNTLIMKRLVTWRSYFPLVWREEWSIMVEEAATMRVRSVKTFERCRVEYLQAVPWITFIFAISKQTLWSPLQQRRISHGRMCVEPDDYDLDAGALDAPEA